MCLNTCMSRTSHLDADINVVASQLLTISSLAGQGNLDVGLQKQVSKHIPKLNRTANSKASSELLSLYRKFSYHTQ
jgi:hypothetical protein